MVEHGVVMLVVAAALLYSLWRLLPAPLRRWPRRRRQALATTPGAPDPHAGCAGCPAGAGCAQRR